VGNNNKINKIELSVVPTSGNGVIVGILKEILVLLNIKQT